MGSDELVARLRPWHAALRTLGARPADADMYRSKRVTAPPPYTLWINDKYLASPKPPRSAKLAIVRMYEAVVLLDLLARVDVRAWKEAVMEVWPTQDMQVWLDDHAFPADAEFKVGIVLADLTTAKHIERLAKLCNLTENDVVSTAFTQLYASLALLIGLEEKQASWRVALRLDLDLFDASASEITKTLTRIYHYVEKCRVNAAPEKAVNKAIIQVEEIEVLAGEHLVLRQEDLGIWKQITESGVRVSHFPRLAMGKDEQSWKEVVEATRSLMSVSHCTSNDGAASSAVRGVHTVRVHTQNSPYVGCFLAAAQVSTSLRVADIEVGAADDWDEDFSSDDDDDQDRAREVSPVVGRYWNLIAYTLLSRHASHKLTTLHMQICNFRLAHVEAMRAIITAPDPLAQLHDRADRLEPLRQLTASRFYLADPAPEFHVNDPDDQDALVELQEGMRHRLPFTTENSITVRVISPPQRDDDPYWKVLLPGQGISWVLKDDFTDLIETALPTDDWRSAVPSFQCIELFVMNEESKEAALQLLELVGRGAKCINMYEYATDDVDGLDDWVREVLVMCPHLEEFIMGVANLSSMNVFVDAAYKGLARLQRLVLGYAGCDRVETFFAVLGDNSHVLSTHLQCLEVNFWIGKQSDVDRVLEASLRMLETNRRLYDIHIGFRLGQRFAHLKRKVQAAFAKVSNERVAIRVAPLDGRCKLAFLSTVNHSATANGALGKLDSGVIGKVFEFAAQSRIRRVASFCVTMGGG